MLTCERLSTPIGTMLIVTDEQGRLRVVDWEDHENRMRAQMQKRREDDDVLLEGQAPREVRDALDAYFAGDIKAIDDLPVAPRGTPFQMQVWAALREIPAGETISYGTLACRIGNPAAVRAVGLANGANPIGVVVPCHRVIGANGSLTGYGGGLERKRWLLAHEARHAGALFGWQTNR
jgi:methylated-DNA-[protein]-cysteine S-methyltransferase